MKEYSEFSQLTERVIHKYTQVEKIKRAYGTDMLLSRAEIHTIAAIGDHPQVNVTSLAKLLGITKGAASQMVYKLVDKGMILKQVSPVSDTEVCLSLTEQGKIAYDAHKEYHATANEHFFQVIRNIPEDVQKQMMDLLREFDKAMDERLKQGGC